MEGTRRPDLSLVTRPTGIDCVDGEPLFYQFTPRHKWLAGSGP